LERLDPVCAVAARREHLVLEVADPIAMLGLARDAVALAGDAVALAGGAVALVLLLELADSSAQCPFRRGVLGAELGFPLLQPGDVAEAVLLAARDDETGQAWVVQPGRDPLKFRFPNVPGPRVDGVGIAPPPV